MKQVALGELTESVDKWDPKSNPNEDFEYVDLSAVDNESKSITSTATLAGANAPSRARQVIAAGDVLVSTVRPNLNAVAPVPEQLDGATASTGFTVLRPNAELDTRYLFHWVRSPPFISDMVRRATGASYPAVTDRTVKNSAIQAPPLDEQRRIAAILDQADAIRAKRRQVLAHLDDLTQSTFHNMFAGRDDPVRRLDQLTDAEDRINYGVVQPGDHTPGGVPLIRVADLAGGVVDRSALKHVSEEIDAVYGRSRLRGTEILVSSVGSIGSIGVARQEDVGSNIARAITRVPITDLVTRSYVSAFLRTAGPQRYFASELRSVAQPTLNVGHLAATEVPLPPRVLQAEFTERVERINLHRCTVKRAMVADDELFASLQSRAFRGEL